MRVLTLLLVAGFAVALLGENTASAGNSLELVQRTENYTTQSAPESMDSDYDGCTDAEEFGPDPRLGGQRDPENAFDFFDVTGDRVVTLSDILQVVSKYGVSQGNPDYDLGYDRSVIGPNQWNLGPGDGTIGLTDIMLVVYQYGHSCQGPPPPDLDLVCDQLRLEANTEGIFDFTCSTQPLPTELEMDGEEGTKREVQVSLAVGDLVEVDSRDLTLAAEEDTSPALDTSGETVEPASFHHPICKVVVCRVTLTSKVELRHLLGSGPNCSWMRYTQKYKVYYPWSGIFEVRNPVVTSGASFPCSQENRTSGIERSGIPFWGESWGRIKWVVGIPTPWGVIGLRTFHPEIRAWFNGRYQVDWN